MGAFQAKIVISLYIDTLQVTKPTIIKNNIEINLEITRTKKLTDNIILTVSCV